MNHSTTNRGFGIGTFTDLYGVECSLQQSSLASQPAIWLGVNDPNPRIMASDASMHGIHTDQKVGWVPYPMPDEVLCNTRMHLSRDMVKDLAVELLNWLHTTSALVVCHTTSDTDE